MGVGVSLYFRILRSFAILMTVMTVVSLPLLYLFWIGRRITSSQPNLLDIGDFSLGNIGSRCVCVCVVCLCVCVSAHVAPWAACRIL